MASAGSPRTVLGPLLLGKVPTKGKVGKVGGLTLPRVQQGLPSEPYNPSRPRKGKSVVLHLAATLLGTPIQGDLFFQPYKLCRQRVPLCL